MGTEESEAVGAFVDKFTRPPTVGQFRVTSGSCKYYNAISCVKSSYSYIKQIAIIWLPVFNILHCKLSANIDFFVVGIHTQPSAGVTAAEINELVNVYNTFRQRYGTNIGFVMGDYNYGGTYVSQSQQDNLDIDQPPFVRFINSTDGTTVTPPSKPYDRIYIVPEGITIQRVGIDTFRDMLTQQQVIQAILTILSYIRRKRNWKPKMVVKKEMIIKIAGWQNMQKARVTLPVYCVGLW